MFLRRAYRPIAILSVILLASFVTVSFINYRTTKASIEQDIVSSSLPLLRENIYSAIEKDLLQPLNVASVMAHDSFLINWATTGEKNVGQITRYLKEIRDAYNLSSTFFVSNSTHNYYHFTGILKVISPLDAHDVWYYNFIRSGLPYRFEVDTNQAADNRLTIFINFRLEDLSHRLLGVVGVGLEMHNFSQFLHEKQQEYKRRIFLTDASGIVLAHSDASVKDSTSVFDLPGIKDVAHQLLQKGSMPVDASYTIGKKHELITARYVPEINWFVMVDEDESAALSPARSALWRTILVGLISSIAIIFISVVTVGRFQLRLERMAVTDELTQAANRRDFESQFRAAMSRFNRYNTPFSLILLDIDQFKDINDSVGHLTGDEVLVAVTELLRRGVRPGDFLARWGGDEFVLLLECNVEEAELTAERLRSSVQRDFPDSIRTGQHSVTISLGVAEYRAEDSVEKLTAKADKALYMSKQSGRNRVTVYRDGGDQV